MLPRCYNRQVLTICVAANSNTIVALLFYFRFNLLALLYNPYNMINHTSAALHYYKLFLLLFIIFDVFINFELKFFVLNLAGR